MTPSNFASNPGRDWGITAILWVLRWLVILPINFLLGDHSALGSANTSISGNPFILFALVVLLDPAMETVIECVLPWWILTRGFKLRTPLIFIMLSASMMALLHAVSPMAALNAWITGAFIAITYSLAVRRGKINGILHATTFHSAINMVGWLIVVIS